MRRQLTNAITGERVTLIASAAETGGAYLEFEDELPSGLARPFPHVHPGMEERWELLQGQVRITIGGRQVELTPGQAVVAPPGVAHQLANIGTRSARLRVRMTPALRWEQAIEKLFAMTATPTPEQLRAWLTEFSDEIAPAPRSTR